MSVFYWILMLLIYKIISVIIIVNHYLRFFTKTKVMSGISKIQKKTKIVKLSVKSCH